MSGRASELRVRIEDSQAKLDRFERRAAAAILAFTLALSVASYGILTLASGVP